MLVKNFEVYANYQVSFLFFASYLEIRFCIVRDSNRRSSVEVFIGPYTYRKFMECFNELYKKHSKVLELETNKLKHTLDTLEETRKDAKTMQKAIHVSVA